MAGKEDIQARFKRRIRLSWIILGTAVVTIFTVAIFRSVYAMAAQNTAVQTLDPKIVAWGFMSAAIAVGLSAIAAGIAVGYVGAAAMGAISEKPELIGRSLIFVGLAEGIAIYGLIIAIIILTKIG